MTGGLPAPKVATLALHDMHVKDPSPIKGDPRSNQLRVVNCGDAQDGQEQAAPAIECGSDDAVERPHTLE
jgi:hypothetical protein